MSLKKIIQFGFYAWGDALYMLDDSMKRVYGWKPYKFGDYELVAMMKNPDDRKAHVYVLYNVDWQDDPKDMFFADCKLIGTIPLDEIEKGGKDLVKDRVLELYDDSMHTCLYRLFKRLFRRH